MYSMFSTCEGAVAVRDFSANKMEMMMRMTILAGLLVPVVAALAAQAAAASEHHHTRTKARAVVTEQLRNSNAYAAPSDAAVQSDMSAYSEGAMTSGTAGH